MAKKLQLSYKEIESRLESFKTNVVPASEIGYEILKAFGKSEKDVSRYKEGKGILKTFDGLLIKGLFCYQAVDTLHLTTRLEALKTDAQVKKAAPKIIAVSDGETLLAYDTRENDTYEQKLVKMHSDFGFFYPLMNVERVHTTAENPADVKAAEKLAKLHDEIRAYNEYNSDDDLHDLNIFITRLLFCFFAEDTGIFTENLFTNFIKQFTKEDGSDLGEMLGQAFQVMNVPNKERSEELTKEINQFPYVNGGLFASDIPIPKMGYKARKIIIECGDLDWKDINPDIFGSMIQAVVNPDVRAKEGMHYTSVPNIMKVINPLFMDDLRAEYKKLTDFYDQKKNLYDMSVLSINQFVAECKPIVRGCDRLLLRMNKMKFFDPACGSGNFLIITYKQLRLLEMDILHLRKKCQPEQMIDFIDGSCIHLEQFYGIELLDFPHEVAMLSLWLAEHQMNNKFHADFGVNVAALPLHNINQIKCGNACRMDWEVVCPHTKDEEVFVFGNPPYLGARLQDVDQKEDMQVAVGADLAYNNLDYISTWFYKGTNYVKNTKAELAFVTTNSICQGEQVPLIWDYIFSQDVEIFFAYTSFKWSNNAKYNAGVTCVIIGLRSCRTGKKCFFYNGEVREVDNITPYLTAAKTNIITKKFVSISDFVEMSFGSMPNDGGFLLLDQQEKDEIMKSDPNCEKFIHPLLGAQEFIRGEKRYCLWIMESNYEEADAIQVIHKRIQQCQQTRLASKRASTQKLAEKPYSFGEVRYKETECIIVPGVSSENRKYIPIGYLDKGTVITNSAFAIYDASLWLFGILTSEMHMVWVRTVGGRLKTDYRYSAGLCYNTFPFPSISDTKKSEIEEAATNVLLARENYPEKTLADLYDPEKMPEDLRAAHEELDAIVESCYPGAPFPNDEARLECLFKLYEKMTADKK
uniref:class I SAM-dependent DNA methyltransferase n=1 Tax=Prevotella sp. TaxID=59823 RepID=UPI003FED6F6A